jgi:hypothetical protein
MDVAEIPWRSTLDKCSHLARDQLVEAVETKATRPHTIDRRIDVMRRAVFMVVRKPESSTNREMAP